MPATAPEEILEQLPSDTTLLAYHIVGDDVLAFVVSGHDVRVSTHICKVETVRRLSRKLAAQWDRFSAGKEFADRHGALLERSARQALTALHSELMAPLESILKEVTGRTTDGPDEVPEIVIVPHGLLHQVPFHALFDGER